MWAVRGKASSVFHVVSSEPRKSTGSDNFLAVRRMALRQRIQTASAEPRGLVGGRYYSTKKKVKVTCVEQPENGRSNELMAVFGAVFLLHGCDPLYSKRFFGKMKVRLRD